MRRPPTCARSLAAVDDMLAIAEHAALRPDARVHWLVQWIKANLLSGSKWNNRRLIIFTEWEDTRRWLERRLQRGARRDRPGRRADRACSPAPPARIGAKR